jgi:tetratricopeptide (TPR) repeat protein
VCRAQLPVWQQFVNRIESADFAFLSVAVDADRERVRPFVEGLSFPTAVDRTGTLGRLFDFDVVPNGLFLDQQGVIRFLHVGGFDIRRPEIAEQVEALIKADFTADAAPAYVQQEPLELEILRTELVERPDDVGLHLALGDSLLREGRTVDAVTAYRRSTELDPEDWSAHFGLGTALELQGDRDAALGEWRTALGLDPANFTVRKQIWRLEHPERFYPEIDLAWQKEQLAREGNTRPA